MTNIKFSSKMHVAIIVSSIVIALGIAIGVICQCAFGSFFNYGGDYSSYKSLTVSYALTDIDGDFNEDKIDEACGKVFGENGVSYYTVTSAETLKGGSVEYRFYQSVSDEKLSACTDKIAADLGLASKSGLSHVSYNTVNGVNDAGRIVGRCAIALGVAVVLQFVYFVIRYKLTMALGALLANVHNLLLFLALLAITRVQVTSAVVAFSAVTVVATMICSAFFFDKVRRNAKDEQAKKLSAFELVDLSANGALLPVAFVCAATAAAAALIAVATVLGSLSLAGLLMPALCAILCFAASFYGSALFTPSVYSRFRQIADKTKRSDYEKQTQNKAD